MRGLDPRMVLLGGGGTIGRWDLVEGIWAIWEYIHKGDFGIAVSLSLWHPDNISTSTHVLPSWYDCIWEDLH